MSNLHFGHWRAAAHNNYLASIHAYTIELSFCTGTPLKRWTYGLYVMLEKIPGVTLADKLRAILTMEAYFNFGNKLHIGRRMIKAANNNQVIPSDTFGSKNGSCAIEVALCRTLFFDIVRQKKFNVDLGYYDAHTCYDRVVHSYTSLANQSAGTPRPIIFTMPKTIQQMKFHLRTGYEDSETNYCGSDTKPYNGLFQGNGSAPGTWLLLKSMLLSHMKSEGHDLKITIAISNEIMNYVALIFVDDGDFPTIANTNTKNGQSGANRYQEALDCWYGGLRTTGGALKPAKFFCMQ